MKPSKLILSIIVISQFCCTSLWFAGNSVMNDLLLNFELEISALGHLTSAVQFGFICGTLIFSILTIADRYSPSKVFFICAVLGALINIGTIWEGNNMTTIVLIRFITGFFLAGIYPVGMKIAADYFEKGLGIKLGYLVGALVLGTSFPHLLRGITYSIAWQHVLLITSLLSIIGGFLILLLVPDGPFRKTGNKVNLSAFISVFSHHKFRSAAFGYFGHMWELYAFWAFVPIILSKYLIDHPETKFNIPLLSFLIIAIGGIACVVGGYFAQLYGSKRIAILALLLSCLCCLISPLIFSINSGNLFIGFLLFWGMVVVADSPLFSTLVAQNTTGEIKATALTIVNCIGFSITIISIQLLNFLYAMSDSIFIYPILAIGPVLGLLALYEKRNTVIQTTK